MIIDARRGVGRGGYHGDCSVESVLRDMAQLGIAQTVIVSLDAESSIPDAYDQEVSRQEAMEKANLDFVSSGTVGEQLRRMRSDRTDHALVTEAIARYPDKLVGLFFVNPWLSPDVLEVHFACVAVPVEREAIPKRRRFVPRDDLGAQSAHGVVDRSVRDGLAV